ncbi:MAG: RloB family protein [Candidatus Dadabacteria bacterium]|nr:RloB family protein [Candidatus Dadabacteria bacterium]
MPPKKRRRFVRPLGKRRYRKMFVLATEGSKTESQYFAIFNDQNLVVHIKFLKEKGGSAPPQVLERMRNYLDSEDLENSDEAWLVVDKDQWTDYQLSQLHEWAQEADNYGFALSNPKFEFWLLLHFEDGRGVSNSRTCSQRLERHIPGYDKDINVRKISEDMIKKAIERAKKRDTPACRDWP